MIILRVIIEHYAERKHRPDRPDSPGDRGGGIHREQPG